MTRMTAREFKKMKSKSKYGNKKVKIDGLTFDSKAEALYYSKLKKNAREGRNSLF